MSDAPRWMLKHEDELEGPVDEQLVINRIRRGDVNPHVRVAPEGSEAWEPISACPRFLGYFTVAAWAGAAWTRAPRVVKRTTIAVPIGFVIAGAIALGLEGTRAPLSGAELPQMSLPAGCDERAVAAACAEQATDSVVAGTGSLVTVASGGMSRVSTPDAPSGSSGGGHLDAPSAAPGSSGPEPTPQAMRKSVASAMPALRAHLAHGRAKLRSGDSCKADSSTRLAAIQRVQYDVLHGRGYFEWKNDAVKVTADDLNIALAYLRGCVDCTPTGTADCESASIYLDRASVDRSLAAPPAPAVNPTAQPAPAAPPPAVPGDEVVE